MAKIKKTKVDGALVYPATIFPAVKDPNTGQTLTEKLSELGSEVGFVEWEQGGVDELGSMVSSEARVRSSFIKAPFKINLNGDYSIYKVVAFDKVSGSFIKTYFTGSFDTTYFQSNDESYIYKIVVANKDSANITPNETFLSYLVSGDKNEIYALNQLATSVGYPIRWEIGSINGETGEAYKSSIRVRSGYINGGFGIKLKDGYKIFSVVSYDKTLKHVGLPFYFGSSSTTSSVECLDSSYMYKVVVFKDEGGNITIGDSFVESIIIYTPNEKRLRELESSNNVLTAKSLGIYNFVECSLDSNGNEVESSTRLTSDYFQSPIRLLLNDGYILFKYQQFDKSKNFIKEVYGGKTLTIEKDDYIYRLVVSKSDGTEIKSSELFIKQFSFGNNLLSEQNQERQSLLESYATKEGFPVMWEQGGVDLFNGGVLIDSALRVRCIFNGSYRIKLKEGYRIFADALYSKNGLEFKGIGIYQGSSSTISEYVQTDNESMHRIIVFRADGGEIKPSDDFIDTFEPIQAEQDEKIVKIIMPEYVYNGKNTNTPTSSGYVFDAFDSILSEFPQYVKKQIVGKQRDFYTSLIGSIQNIPVCISSAFNLNNIDVLFFDGYEYAITDRFEIDNTYYARLNNKQGHIPTGMVFTDASGNRLGECIRKDFGRFTAYIGDAKIFVVSVEPSTRLMTFTVIDGSSVDSDGNITDSERVYITSYSDAEKHTGENIYSYDFNFYGGNEENDRVLIISGVHGYEPYAIMAVIAFFEELTRSWKNDSCLSCARYANYTVIPVLNPWSLDNNTNYNVCGVDLNRNFSEGWVQSNEIYHRWSGYEPNSEPETKSLNELLQANLKSYKCLFDFHNDGSLMGSILTLESSDKLMGKSLSKTINGYFRKYTDIPSWLFCWKNGSKKIFTITENPKSGDLAYLSQNSDYENGVLISSATNSIIVVEGITYSRDSSLDFDMRNVYPYMFYSPSGSLIRTAKEIGIDNVFNPEYGGGWWLNSEENRKAQIEVTSNIIIAAVKNYFSIE